jgi:hypothetical protein
MKANSGLESGGSFQLPASITAEKASANTLDDEFRTLDHMGIGVGDWAEGLEWGAAFRKVIEQDAHFPKDMDTVTTVSEASAQSLANTVVSSPEFQAAAKALLQENLGKRRARARSRQASFELNEKFISDGSNFAMSFGDKRSFLGGLDDFIGRPKDPHIFDNMVREHCYSDDSNVSFSPSNYAITTTPLKEWSFVVTPSGAVDAGYSNEIGEVQLRHPMLIDELLKHKFAVEAGLTKTEIIAARLYTGPMFMKYNAALRDTKANKHRYLYTLHVLSSCIIKLSRIHTIQTLYRGIKGGALPRTFFIPDDHGSCGGTEFAFMSTTTNREVATKYASNSAGKASVVFQVVEGAVDRGADLSWLSQYPMEDEVVFPPMTHLQVVGNPRVCEGTLYMKLRPNVNLRLRTVDEVLNRAKTNYLDMCDWFFADAKNYNFTFVFDVNKVMPGWLDEFSDHINRMKHVPGERFNEQKYYRDAVNVALDLKEGTINKVIVLNSLKLIPLATTHDSNTFRRTIERVSLTSATKFARTSEVFKFVRPDGGNYSVLWSLRLQNGSWTRLVREGDHAPSIYIACAKLPFMARVQKWLASFDSIRFGMHALFGDYIIDSMLGFEGEYFYMGQGRESKKPYFQLCRENGMLASKYIYKAGGRWYAGSSIGSDVGDLRSKLTDSESPELEETGTWERCVANGIKGTLLPSRVFRVAPDVVVNSSVETAARQEVQLIDSSENGNMQKIIDHKSENLKRFRGSFLHSNAHEQNVQQHMECFAYVNRLLMEGDTEEVMREMDMISPIELHSIETFCDQTRCKLPSQLRKRIVEEQIRGENIANVWAVLMMLAVCLGACIGGVLLILGAFFQSSDLVWYTRGFWSAGLLAGFVISIGIIIIFADTIGGKLVGFAWIAFLFICGTCTYFAGAFVELGAGTAQVIALVYGGLIILGMAIIASFLAS